jgi:hypothetical protein
MELIYLWINERHGDSIFDVAAKLKAEHYPSRSRCELVHVAKIFIAEGHINDELITVDEYRDRARRLPSFSETRYQNLVAHVRHRPEFQLVVFLVHHGYSAWNVLCAVETPQDDGVESCLLYGMMQCKYVSSSHSRYCHTVLMSEKCLGRRMRSGKYRMYLLSAQVGISLIDGEILPAKRISVATALD